MKLTLPTPPETYDARDQVAVRNELENRMTRVLEGGQDCEIGAGRLILLDTVTGERYSLSMVSGVLTETLLA